MPTNRRPGSRSTSCASSSAGRPAAIPVRCPPASTSTTTSAVTPAAVAASDRSRAFSGVSVAWTKPACHLLRLIARSIFVRVTLAVVISTCSIPCSSITSASPTLAVQIPTDPEASWSLAIAGHLWVFAWGLLAMPFRDTVSCRAARLASRASRSTHSAGVSSSHLETSARSSPSGAIAARSAGEYPLTDEGTQTAALPAAWMKRRRDRDSLLMAVLRWRTPAGPSRLWHARRGVQRAPGHGRETPATAARRPSADAPDHAGPARPRPGPGPRPVSSRPSG